MVITRNKPYPLTERRGATTSSSGLEPARRVARPTPPPPPAVGNRDQPRHQGLDRDDRERHPPVHPFGEPLRVPRRPGGKRLSPEVVVEGGEVEPRGVATHELRDT